MKSIVAACVLLLAVAAPAFAADADVTAANKRLVVDFFNFDGTRAQRAEQMLTPDYVQHNPRFLAWEKRLNVHAREAWVRVLPDAAAKGVRLVDLGGISLRRPIVVMVENDLVHAIYRGLVPDPAAPGEMIEAFAFEAFRIRDGRFSEHWDQVKLTKGWTNPSPTPLEPAQADAAPAPVPQPPADCIASADTLAANKKLALAFLQGPMTRENLARRAGMLAPGFIQHDPGRLKIEEGVAEASPKIPALVVADCDYAAVVWRQVLPDPDDPSRSYEAFSFDTVRVAGGRIAEHWDGATP